MVKKSFLTTDILNDLDSSQDFLAEIPAEITVLNDLEISS